jgi:predicted HTH transcriptional regulator
LDTIKEYIEKLKEKGMLRRIGQTSAGYWQILEKNNKEAEK